MVKSSKTLKSNTQKSGLGDFFRHKSKEKSEKLCLYFEMTPDDFIELGGKTYR